MHRSTARLHRKVSHKIFNKLLQTILTTPFPPFSVHDFYSSHVHQMANQAAARQSPAEPSNLASSPISNASHPVHNPAASSYYHHYHHSVVSSAHQNSATNAGYSPPQNINQNGSLNGNESPNSGDQFTSNNNIQLPETPNSLVTTIMGPTSVNSNSNDGGTNAVNETSASESSTIISNNNYSPWCSSTGHHQLPLSNSSPIHSSSYNSAHHPSASLYSSHHNLPSPLISHQNISGFAHPHGGKSFGISQPFYSWYWNPQESYCT